MWTPCLMHNRCVISTMFGSCFSFFFKTFIFFIFYFYVFSVIIIILYNKNKVFLFHFCIFVYLDASGSSTVISYNVCPSSIVTVFWCCCVCMYVQSSWNFHHFASTIWYAMSLGVLSFWAWKSFASNFFERPLFLFCLHQTNQKGWTPKTMHALLGLTSTTTTTPTINFSIWPQLLGF